MVTDTGLDLPQYQELFSFGRNSTQLKLELWQLVNLRVAWSDNK